jgi:hypothetical protein
MSQSILKSFHSPDHAGMRLSGTVIRYKGRPTYIARVRGNWDAEAIDMETGNNIHITSIIDESLVDVSPVPLGFCQIGETARYLCRQPARRNKQGLSQESVHCEGMPIPNIFGSASLLKALSSTIVNNYVTFKKALVAVRKQEGRSLAFHRNWAVFNSGESLHILYKFFGSVGKVDEEDHIILNKDFDYLKETLQDECGDQYD